MNNKIFALVLSLLLSYSIGTLAQETKEKEYLSVILINLQERYKVQFNYASALIDGIKTTPPGRSQTLEQSITYLSNNCNLQFVFISKDIISIKKKNPVLCGYLIDKDTGKALPYVTVQNGDKGTITNEEGFFEIAVDKTNNAIKIRHVGYLYLQREAKFFNLKACSRIYLRPDRQQLAEVTVYDYLVRGIDKLDNGAYRIDFKKFSILPGLIQEDVLRSVQALPGIQSIDETVSNINIRGGSNDQNLVLWDGIKMYQSGHFFGLISMYNPYITQKVALYKNGSSASRTDGVSGTIAMGTNEYLNTDLKASISINLIDINGFVDAPLGEKASIQVAARKAISDFIETPTYSAYFNRIAQDTELERNTPTVNNSDIAFDFYDASLRLLYHPTKKDRFRINFIYATNEVLFNENATIDGLEEIRRSDLRQGSVAAAINHKRKWGQNLNTEITAYNTDYKLKATNANILENQRFLQKNEVSETGIELKAKHTVNERIKLTSGYHFVETKVTNLDDVDNPRFILLAAEVLRTHGIYTEMGISANRKRTRANLGLRFNYLDKFQKTIWEPRLSLGHNINKNLNIELLGEFKHQNTSQIINFQNDFLGVEKRRWQLSNNTTIPIITSKQASLGLTYTHKGWLANIVPFYKKVNGITTQSQGFQNNYEFVKSAGTYDARGIDLLFRKQFSKSSTWLSYSYLESNYRFNELPETTFPNNFDITHTLTFGTNYKLNKFLLAGGLNWHTGKPFTAPIGDNPITDEGINYAATNRERQQHYLRLDLSAKRDFKWGKKTKAQIGLALWNVLNRNNTINTFYRVQTLDQAQQVQQRSLGITPNAMFRLVFL